MEAIRPKVLLVGKTSRSYSSLPTHLRKQGCEYRFAASSQEVYRLFDKYSFDLVLVPIRLGCESLYHLVDLLNGSGTTLFYSQAVEDGCWWLPALRLGTNCFGAPALRPSEFVAALDESIQEIRRSLRRAIEPRPVITPRFSGSAVPLPFSSRVSLTAMPDSLTSTSLAAHKALG